MGDKDPPPFGYTFSDFFEGASAGFDNGGPSLLSEMENQSLNDFFNADPFDPSFAHLTDSKDMPHDYNNWDTFAPATVHRVTSTIPDQPHLHGFHHEQSFAQPLLPNTHLNNTHDDLQAASTLFNNSQPSYSNGPAQSLGMLEPTHPGVPMVATQHGLLNEQLAALLPNHSEDGTLDAQFAAQWAASNIQRQHDAEFGPLLRKPSLKRPYVFGTDNSFSNPAGFSLPHGQESDDQATRRVSHQMRRPQPLHRTSSGMEKSRQSPTGTMALPLALTIEPSDDEQSEIASSDDDNDEDRPSKKRRKSNYRIGKDSPRKGSRNGKARKASLADEGSKKKRSSTAAQKLQRENLSEEQKRSNHILSEQKRRNLIKRGFDDLHDLVPEIRNGGLSKSSVLMEAANFLEKLIQENNSFWRMAGGVPVTASG